MFSAVHFERQSYYSRARKEAPVASTAAQTSQNEMWTTCWSKTHNSPGLKCFDINVWKVGNFNNIVYKTLWENWKQTKGFTVSVPHLKQSKCWLPARKKIQSCTKSRHPKGRICLMKSRNSNSENTRKMQTYCCVGYLDLCSWVRRLISNFLPQL